MKLIGYWLRHLGDDEYLAPQELPRLPEAQREPIARYLDAGIRVQQYRGFSQCRFYCGNDHNGSGELSDGEWQWPEGLAHYVRVHGVTLPAQFTTTALSGRSIAADFPRTDVSEQFWLDWCKTHRDPDFADALRSERQAAEQRIEAEVLRQAHALECERGVSSKECAQAECAQAALVNAAFCALHSIDIEAIRITHLYTKRALLQRWVQRERLNRS